MTTTTEVDLSAKDIADRTGFSVRMINIYRANAETRMGRKLGYKVGKTYFYKPDEVREILKSRESNDSGNAGTSRNFREAVNFSNVNAQAEDSTLNGMEAIVAASDQQAMAVGQAIGNRFVQVMWTTAIGTMQAGMTQMGQQFDEMYSAVALPLTSQPQLPGTHPNAHALPEAEEG